MRPFLYLQGVKMMKKLTGKFSHTLRSIGDRNNHYVKIYAPHINEDKLHCDLYNHSGKIFSAVLEKDILTIECVTEETIAYLEKNGFWFKTI